MSRPIVVICRMIWLLRIVGPYQHPHPRHSRAGGGAVHSINRRHARQKEGKSLEGIAYAVSAAICWSNQARSRFHLALSGESFTRRSMIAFPWRSAANAFPRSLD
jgi:hypothetical protein